MTDDPGALTPPLVTARIESVSARIAQAAASAGRDPGSVRLMLATKMQSAAAVRVAVDAARRLGLDVLVGENRVQELVAKAPVFTELGVRADLIGPLQSNKAGRALETMFSAPVPGAVESVGTADTATRLGARAAAAGRVLDVMVQVNVSGEPTKSGVTPSEAFELALRVADDPGLRLVGFMTIGARSDDVSVVRSGFAALRTVRDEVLALGSPGTEHAVDLSMGMSGDLEAAVAEGATIVRVGTAVFGARDRSPSGTR